MVVRGSRRAVWPCWAPVGCRCGRSRPGVLCVSPSEGSLSLKLLCAQAARSPGRPEPERRPPACRLKGRAVSRGLAPRQTSVAEVRVESSCVKS